MPDERRKFIVTPTYERPGSGVIIIDDPVHVLAANEEEARDFIAAHLIAARLTPISIEVSNA